MLNIKLYAEEFYEIIEEEEQAQQFMTDLIDHTRLPETEIAV